MYVEIIASQRYVVDFLDTVLLLLVVNCSQ